MILIALFSYKIVKCHSVHRFLHRLGGCIHIIISIQRKILPCGGIFLLVFLSGFPNRTFWRMRASAAFFIETTLAKRCFVLMFKSCQAHQQKRNFCLPKVPFLFIQAAGLAYHHDAVVDIISPCGAVSHHASACIFPAAWWYTMLRIDDIQHFVLMICKAAPWFIYESVI